MLKFLHLFPTLCNPVDCIACQALLSMGFLRQEYWSGLPCPPPGDLPKPGIEPTSLMSPALAGKFFTTSATQEAQCSNKSTLRNRGDFNLNYKYCRVKNNHNGWWKGCHIHLFLKHFFLPLFKEWNHKKQSIYMVQYMCSKLMFFPLSMLLLLLSHFSHVWLCDPVDSLLPGFSVPGILQARTLEWVAISFSNAWKWKVKVKSLSCVQLLPTSWTAAYQAPPLWEFPGKSTRVGCHCLLHKALYDHVKKKKQHQYKRYYDSEIWRMDFIALIFLLSIFHVQKST